MDKLAKIEKGKLPPNIPKPTNRKGDFRLHQFGGGGILETNSPGQLRQLRGAYWQSMINCGKPVIGGGFNPRNQEEIEEIYGKRGNS